MALHGCTAMKKERGSWPRASELGKGVGAKELGQETDYAATALLRISEMRSSMTSHAVFSQLPQQLATGS
jgi:hypothetical protein